MADLRFQDRLRPALLDRLSTPDAESGGRSIMSMEQLRRAVTRDLEWLLNSTSLDTIRDLGGYPHAAESVINYGMPDLTGRTHVDLREFAKRIRQAILVFEPRLLRKTVKVKPAGEDDDDGGAGNALHFRIEAELWGEPLPIQLYLKTEIDLESGSVAIKETYAED